MESTYSFKLHNDEARSLHGKNIERVLTMANIDKLKESICEFKNMDIKNMTDTELKNYLEDVLSIKLEGGISFLLLCLSTLYMKKEHGFTGFENWIMRICRIVN